MSGTSSSWTDYCVGHTPRGLHLGAHAATALATLLAFTDGLVERRGESLDAGLDRFARAAATPAATLDGQLTALIDGLTHGASEDDIALAFRWTTPAGSGWLSGGADLGL